MANLEDFLSASLTPWGADLFFRRKNGRIEFPKISGIRRKSTAGVLFVRHGFLPDDHDAGILFFADRDVRHGRVFARAVPVLDARGATDDVARADFDAGLAPFLGIADAVGDDQDLSDGMIVPEGAGAGLEGDGTARALHVAVGAVESRHGDLAREGGGGAFDRLQIGRTRHDLFGEGVGGLGAGGETEGGHHDAEHRPFCIARHLKLLLK